MILWFRNNIAVDNEYIIYTRKPYNTFGVASNYSGLLHLLARFCFVKHEGENYVKTCLDWYTLTFTVVLTCGEKKCAL